MNPFLYSTEFVSLFYFFTDFLIILVTLKINKNVNVLMLYDKKLCLIL